MPHVPFTTSAVTEDHVQDVELKVPEKDVPKRKNSVLDRIQKIGHWFKEDEAIVTEPSQVADTLQEKVPEELSRPSEEEPLRRPSLLGRRGYKRAVPTLPRPLTFRRQNSEKRERLLPVEPTITERRAVSADRRPRTLSRNRRCSPTLSPLPSLSAPEVGTPVHYPSISALQLSNSGLDLEGSEWADQNSYELPNLSPLDGPPPPPFLEDDEHPEVQDERELQAELESKWILNLSMHFRDKSDREKFFVTYAQEPNRWRRVTISLDYRDAQSDSLEADLKSLHYQRDKSARIYEAVRDSLGDIQFFDTVTNLKLQTDDGRLHVHVTEDVNEIISYPATSLVEHIHCNRYRESELEFDAHLSGFVYRVRVDDQVLIKKEIPGPDTVDEFLYEINALDALQDSRSVIKFHGLVIDEDFCLVKGLLISFAPRGSLVDMLYDYKGTDQLPWERRERWAFQIIQGLSEIHEAGFVQGDFTLSNIVIDGEDDAKIIDINRRGCPVGWEPPELLNLIRSGQRISMCIGVKSDLFQLGMVLWALAEKLDEPENVERLDNRLPPVSDAETPLWFRRVVEICLSEKPRDRLGAKELIAAFPPSLELETADSTELKLSDHSIRSRRSDKQYIDPASAVRLEDIEEHRREHIAVPPSHLTSEPYTFADAAPSTNYRFQSDGSYVLANKDSRPLARRRKPSSSATSVSSADIHEHTRKRGDWQYMRPGRRPDLAESYGQELARNDSRDAHARHVRSTSVSSDESQTRGRRSPNGKMTRFVHDTESLRGVVTLPGDSLDSRYFGRNFRPPAHQDSGFDEDMIAGIESSRPSLEIQSCLPELDEHEPLNTVQPESITAPTPLIDITKSNALHPPSEQATPHSPPEPSTPFSYHTPLTSPLDEATVPTETSQAVSGAMHSKTGMSDSLPEATQLNHDCL